MSLFYEKCVLGYKILTLKIEQVTYSFKVLIGFNSGENVSSIQQLGLPIKSIFLKFTTVKNAIKCMLNKGHLGIVSDLVRFAVPIDRKELRTLGEDTQPICLEGKSVFIILQRKYL